MRQSILLLVLLLLVMAACAETAEPPVPAAATPTAAAPLPTPAAATPTPAAPLPTPAALATADRSASDAASTAPTPTAASAGSPWPTFLRELDFGIPAGNSYAPRALVLHPGLGRLYVRTHGRWPGAGTVGYLTVLDLDSGQVLAVVETGYDSYSEGALAIDPIRDRVYVTNPEDLTASVLEAETLDPVSTLGDVKLFALDAEGGRLYVVGDGSIHVFNAESYESLLETALSPYQEALILAADPANGRLYLAHREDGRYVLGVYDADTLQLAASAPLPGWTDVLLPDPQRGRLYVTANNGEHNLFWTLDSDGRLLDEQVLGEWTQKTQLALDPAGDRLFLGRDAYGNYGITVLDLETGREIADIPLPRGPGALAWHGAADQLLASHTYVDQISVVDAGTGQVRATFSTSLNLVDLAVDAGRGHLYLTDTAGRLHVLDSDTDEELAVLPGQGRIAVDGPHGRLYTGGVGADRVRVFDADRLQQTGEIRTKGHPVADAYNGGLYLVAGGIHLTSLETMTITGVISDTLPQHPGYSPNPAAVGAVVDPGSGRVFAIINNGVPGSNNGNYLYVYEPETYQKVLTDNERSPWPLDVDPNTGRAYVSRTHLAGRSTSLLEQGREYAARLDAVFGWVRVDPALGRVYLTLHDDHEGYLLVLDANNLDVLGGVPIPGGFVLRALDTQRHLLYLATEGGRVQVWSATGGELPPPVEPSPADLPAGEAHRLFLAPSDTPIFGASLYRSGDEGASWLRINGNLPDRGVYQLVVSPTFARDRTLFAVLFATDEGLGIWRSTDAGQSWRMANTGLSDLSVTDLAISPAFATDQTLVAMTRKQGLFRSTDGGQSWTSLTDRYRPEDLGVQSSGGVFISPTYADDQTFFVSHYGLQRSTDGGETWDRVFPRLSHLAISPAFATDHTLYIYTGDGGLLRSTDGGDSWQPANTGLTLTNFGSGRIILSPDYASTQIAYFIWTPSSPEAPVQFYRSTNGGQLWKRLVGEPPRASTPVELGAEGSAFLALDESGKLVRWSIAALEWQAVGLPPLSEITFDHLILSPDFAQNQIMWAASEGAGILRSQDAGRTWTNTEFPTRATIGTPIEPVTVPPDTLLVGTPLGLYQSDGGGPWTPVGGGLPQGVAVKRIEIGEDGSWRVLLGGEGDGSGQRVFVSTDDGQTWTQPIPTLPRAIAPEDLQLSPTFATDRIAFIATSWGKPWRTAGGEEWAEFDLPGEGALSAMQLSPAFDRDGLILARLQDNSLWRSTDGGDTWTDVSGPWGDEAPQGVVLGTGYILEVVTFAPDGVLLSRAGNVLYRSADRGATWTGVLDLAPLFVQVIFTPDYVHDGTLYLVQGRTLYRSTDRGQTWQTLPPAPWSEFDEIKLQRSPTFAQDDTLLVWRFFDQVFLSSDGGRSWRDLSDSLPSAGIRQILFSPDYATEGLIYLIPHGGGLYKRVGDSAWLPITEDVLPLPERSPTPAPRPSPTPTSVPVACAIEPERFHAVWQQVSQRLGCPEQPAEQVFMAEQPFERGRMIWDSSQTQIYVLPDRGSWQAFADTFVEGVDLDYDPALPPPPQQPQRGFGKVWREQLGGPEAAIGWALESERPVNGWQQRFERGLLIWTDAALEGEEGTGTAYLLYDDGTWQAVSAPAP